jgi:hypothetical protein
VKGTVGLLLTQHLKWVAAAAIMLTLGIGGTIVWRTQKPPSKTAVRMLPPASPASPAVLPAAWRARFADGTEVEVIALNDPSNAGQWWKLDGSLTADPNFRANRAITMTYRQARRLDVIMRMTGSALVSKNLTIRSDTPSRTASIETGGDSQRLVKMLMPVPRDQSSGTLRLGLAGGPWPNELNLSCANGEDPPAGSTGAGVQFVEICEEKGRTVVRVEVPDLEDTSSDNFDVVVVANGKELRPAATLSSGTNFQYTFSCTRDKVTKIIARSRPYQWVEFKNVAFSPLPKPTSVAVLNAEKGTPVRVP